MMKYLIIIFCALTLFSCGDMHEIYSEFADDGEIVYLKKPFEAVALAGKGRVKLKFSLGSGTEIQQCVVKYENDTKEKFIDIDELSIKTDFELEIGDLAEGQHAFKIKSINDKGQESLPIEIRGRSYGENYTKGLTTSKVLSISATELNCVFAWKENKFISKKEIVFQSSDDQEVVTEIPLGEMSTSIVDFLKGSTLKIVDYFVPEVNAIDTFTVITEIQLPVYFMMSADGYENAALPTDFAGTEWGGNISKLWNGVVSDGDFYHTGAPGDAMPQHFTVNLGRMVKLHSFKIFPRPTATNVNPSEMEV